jgi:hypothetical protein
VTNLEAAIGNLEQVTNLGTVGRQTDASAHLSVGDELDGDHDNLAFVGRQLEAMAASYGQQTTGGPPSANVRFHVEQQGGRSVTALLEKMFIKELHDVQVSA